MGLGNSGGINNLLGSLQAGGSNPLSNPLVSNNAGSRVFQQPKMRNYMLTGKRSSNFFSRNEQKLGVPLQSLFTSEF